MTNIAWEIAFIIIGSIICISFLRRINGTDRLLINFKILYVISMAINFLVVEFLGRGAMVFGDGYDYYQRAQFIIDNYGFNLSTMLEFKHFIDVSQSWHFIATWEFTLFMGLFSSTRCIALFHIVLTNLSSIIWIKFFERIGMRKSGLVAATILVVSPYIRNFTTPALRDALVYFLFTVIALWLEEFYLNKTYKSLIKISIPLIILVFTRMYTAVAVIAIIGILALDEVRLFIISKISYKRVLLLLFIGVCAVMLFFILVNTDLFNYALSWFYKTNFGIVMIIDIIKRIINFLYGPFIFHIFGAQNLYYPSYLSAFIRLLATPVFIQGILRLRCYKNRKCIYIVLLVPFLISLCALSVGKLESATRQYMNYYPLLCIIYGIGYYKYEDDPLEIDSEGV